MLLIIGGGIAAYKSLDLIRRLKERGLAVRCILTKAAEHFVTPLAAGAIAGERVFTDLFDPAHEFDVGHIRLAREADLIVVAPATADLMAKMAGGHANDLATAVLLATSAKILLAPAMNPAMWANKATQRNLAQLAADGVALVGPNEGEMAEAGERGARPHGRAAGDRRRGREAAARATRAAAEGQTRAGHLRPDARADRSGALYRQPLLRQAGPRHRRRRRAAGADVTLVSGPVNLPDPPGVNDRACRKRARHAGSGRARAAGRRRDLRRRGRRLARRQCRRAEDQEERRARPRRELALAENPDILSTVAHRKTKRPQLVIGFAAETENVAANAKAKLAKKGCDWILANDVSPADRHHGRRPQHHRTGDRERRRTLAAAEQGRRRRDADRAHRRRAEGRKA